MTITVFSASWCPPCQRYKPIVAAFEESSGVPVTRIDIDESPEDMNNHAVKTVPTTVLQDEHGNELDRLVGVQTVDELYELINH